MSTGIGIDGRQIVLRTVGRLLSDLGPGARTDDDCLIALEPLAACLAASRVTLVLLPVCGRTTELVCAADFPVAERSTSASGAASKGAAAGPILALALADGAQRLGSLYLERPVNANAFDDDEVFFARGIASLIALRLGAPALDGAAPSDAGDAAAAMESVMRVAVSVGHDLNNILAVLMSYGERLGSGDATPAAASQQIMTQTRRAAAMIRLQLDAAERARQALGCQEPIGRTAEGHA
jgi:hypothetical protein